MWGYNNINKSIMNFWYVEECKIKSFCYMLEGINNVNNLNPKSIKELQIMIFKEIVNIIKHNFIHTLLHAYEDQKHYNIKDNTLKCILEISYKEYIFNCSGQIVHYMNIFLEEYSKLLMIKFKVLVDVHMESNIENQNLITLSVSVINNKY